MSTSDFAKTTRARAQARFQMLALEQRGSASRRDRMTLEHRIEGVLRAARIAGHRGGRSRPGIKVPKT